MESVLECCRAWEFVVREEEMGVSLFERECFVGDGLDWVVCVYGIGFVVWGDWLFCVRQPLSLLWRLRLGLCWGFRG